MQSVPEQEQAAVADRSAPLSLSLFGEDEQEAPESLPMDAHALAFSAWPPQMPAAVDQMPTALQPLDSADSLNGIEQAASLPEAETPAGNGNTAALQALVAQSIRDREQAAAELAARVEAWAQLMQICAAELELGRSIWEAHAAGGSLQEFRTCQPGQHYLMALGNVRFASCALASAMRQPSVGDQLGTHRDSLLADAKRCSVAWDAPTQGEFGMTLHQAACEACEQSGTPGLGVLLASASLDTADFARLPPAVAWTPGRCSLTLLPLQRVPSAPLAAWGDESSSEQRMCLEALSQLWTNRVDSALPRWISSSDFE
ncbi:hypothetical protein WJX73_006769 [Symbiochloris irregularis]|uniref:Synergin gamma C-terminal domain-containing protein n=1 Tax=Symbiochloris irregularis TaxID=706552 RepID=A0AAW1P6Q6_9CHLO